jgi:hypothetical protein
VRGPDAQEQLHAVHRQARSSRDKSERWVSEMKTYEICVVSKEYRYLEVQAENEDDAKDKAWGLIENVLNHKPADYDTELYVEGEVQ